MIHLKESLFFIFFSDTIYDVLYALIFYCHISFYADYVYLQKKFNINAFCINVGL